MKTHNKYTCNKQNKFNSELNDATSLDIDVLVTLTSLLVIMTLETK